MSEDMASCVEPIEESEAPAEVKGSPTTTVEEAKMEIARVGAEAPDFTANAYVEGGFRQVSLSDYAGQWRMICFYPGDFTFV